MVGKDGLEGQDKLENLGIEKGGTDSYGLGSIDVTPGILGLRCALPSLSMLVARINER